MDIIIRMAQNFSKIHLRNIRKPEEIIDQARLQLEDIDNILDKIKFINILYAANRANFEAHLQTCTEKENCLLNYNHEIIDYFLNQELNRFGFKKPSDSFSNLEVETFNNKIEDIIEDIQTIKDGQQIIYEDLTNELNELKELYFIGKKKWYQIWLGKVVEMTISGIITETVSKKIITTIQEMANYALNK
jgi:hypothetical protein